MNAPISVPRTTIGAHRLWTTLWMSLGQTEENVGCPGGNQLATGAAPTAFHSAVTAFSRAATAPVDTRSRVSWEDA